MNSQRTHPERTSFPGRGYAGHPDIKGMFAVDAGGTSAVGKTMSEANYGRRVFMPVALIFCQMRLNTYKRAIWTLQSTSSLTFRDFIPSWCSFYTRSQEG
jgi:hypothetical protein